MVHMNIEICSLSKIFNYNYAITYAGRVVVNNNKIIFLEKQNKNILLILYNVYKPDNLLKVHSMGKYLIFE